MHGDEHAVPTSPFRSGPLYWFEMTAVTALPTSKTDIGVVRKLGDAIATVVRGKPGRSARP
jgi:hypothetical protein